MRCHRISCLALIVLISSGALGQSTSPASLELSRRNPDGWFTVSLPKLLTGVERRADVDGRFYASDILGIDYEYTELASWEMRYISITRLLREEQTHSHPANLD